MPQTINTDICVIGAGAGGLTIAAVAAQMGVATVLVEKGKMGGDCLNYGCVPSKALLAAARAAERTRHLGKFGIDCVAPEIDPAGVHGHIHGTIAKIAEDDSEERFEGLGVTVLKAAAKFTGPSEIAAGDTRVRARRFVIATGSRPLIPAIGGLGSTPYLTNETIFDLKQRPGHLIVVGGGPIGVEMAQAHRRLGARVTVFEMASILANDDPQLVGVLRECLTAEGIDLREGTQVASVTAGEKGISVTPAGMNQEPVVGTHLLVAAGRSPHVDGLDLAAAGIEFDAAGIKVDRRLRTSNRKIFAIGDVVGDHQFTHIASYHAGIVIRNALFRLPAKIDKSAFPRVTYTSPELAQVGMTEPEARANGLRLRVMSWPFAENHRARADGETEGMVKAVVTPKGAILGAGIVGPGAGELIQVWGLAIQNRLKIGKIANMIAPYPTLGEASKRAAGEYFTPTLFGPRVRSLVRMLGKFG